MDVFKSPLNSAHHQRRKGDSLEESGRYIEAIQCHAKASEYLLAAQAITSDKQALESLGLQHNQHLKKQDLLRRKLAQVKLYSVTAGDSSSQVLHTMITSREVDKAQLGSDVMQTMEECNSLLHILDARAEERQITSGVDYFTTAGMARGCKYNKHADMVLEELRIHNDALRAHVMQLLTECEDKDLKIARLMDENHRLRQPSTENSDVLQECNRPAYEAEAEIPEQPLPTPKDIKLDDVPNLPLAPLEKPDFDFTSFPLGNAHETVSKDT